MHHEVTMLRTISMPIYASKLLRHISSKYNNHNHSIVGDFPGAKASLCLKPSWAAKRSDTSNEKQFNPKDIQFKGQKENIIALPMN